MNLMETETLKNIVSNQKLLDNNNDLENKNQNMDTSTSPPPTISQCPINKGFEFYPNSTTDNIVENNNINLNFYKNNSSYDNAKDIQNTDDQSAINKQNETFTFFHRQMQSVSIPSKSKTEGTNKCQSQFIVKQNEETSLNNRLNGNYYQPLQFYSSSKNETDLKNNINMENTANKSAFNYICNDKHFYNNNEKIQPAHSCGSGINERKTVSKDIPETITGQYNESKKLLCRNEDQENAFRRIEDVHNYAKLNRFNYNNMIVSSSNSSNQDDDEDDDEDEEDDDEDDEDDEENDNDDSINSFHRPGCKKVKAKLPASTINNQEDCSKIIMNNFSSQNDGNTTPDHHARRPMNAFLIFCKRHRGIVREKYKHLENRSITKVLGDWWASLDITDKNCYTILAKQYKDAFFNANPNFKWYKLPAPPLRTLNTRPSNNDRSSDLFNSELEQPSGLVERNDMNAETTPKYQWINNNNQSVTKTPSSIINGNVGIFKLADETQLGGLSILLDKKKVSDQHSSQLQTVLENTTDLLKDKINNVSNKINCEPFENMRGHAMEMLKNEFVNNEKMKLKRSIEKRAQSFSSSEDDISFIGKNTSRSCKGKKYQEFMNSGQIAVLTKKPKTEKVSIVNKTDSSSGDSSDQKFVSTQKQSSISNNIDRDSKVFLSSPESPTKFDTIAFDLEEKINSLPALNLEEYLQRKRNTKTKKKINSKRRIVAPAVAKNNNQQKMKTAQEVKESLQMVGSKKRKARKESITRRDLNTTTVHNDSNIVKNVVIDSVVVNQCEIKNEPINDNITATLLASSHFDPNVNNNNNNNNNFSTSDLLILAEVATNHIEIK